MSGVLLVLLLVTMYTFAHDRGILVAQDRVIRGEDLTILMSSINKFRDTQITTQLLTLQKDRCTASGRPSEVLSTEITELLLEYKANTSCDFPLPTCDELSASK